MKRDDAYYEAMLARDPRFDGKFFVGVKTTGIYCRPICPAKPKRKNVEFFSSHLAAEKAGYRPCIRCRPESAPLSPAWMGKSAVVQRAIRMITGPQSNLNEDQFAEKLGLTARHLRRLFQEEIGKTPKQLIFENRLNLSRKLIAETNLSMSEVAFAAGFGSVRRFNGAFLRRFKRTPTQIRRRPIDSPGIVISLSYRPPYDFKGLLHFYRCHQVANLEWFTGEKMHRVVEIDNSVGFVAISDDPKNSRLLAEIDFPDISKIHFIVGRIRGMFDLDSDPLVVANSLELDRSVKKILKKYPGIRLPTAWDPFEAAISIILGQLVSVEQGRRLLGDLVQQLGRDSGLVGGSGPIKFFPSPAEIVSGNLSPLKTTAARKRTLVEFSRAVLENRISLDATQDVQLFLKRALEIPGIGPWSAAYMALKCLRHTDSFPTTDLILARALEIHSPETLREMSPWRGYCAALFWREYSLSLKKRRLP